MAMLSCPHCGFSKELPAEKLPQEAVKVTCPKCKEPFTFDPAAAVPTAAPPQPPAAKPAPESPAPLAEQVTITCPHCNHKRQVPRAKIPPRPIKITCPQCQKPFPFRGDQFRSEVTLQRPELHPSLAPTPKAQAPRPKRKHLASIGELFSRSWQAFTRRILTLIGINLLAMLLAGVAYLLLGGGLGWLQEVSGHNPLVTIPAIMLMLLFALAVISAIGAGMTYAIVDETLGVREALGYGINRWRAFLWLFSLLGFILFGGYLAFFIPGVIFTIWFIFAQFVLAEDHIGGMDALLMSKAYVRGHFWEVFGRLLLLVVINSILSAIPLVGMLLSLLLGPFSLIYYHEIYRDLREMKAPVVYNGSRGEKAKYLLAGAAGHLIIPVLLLVLAGPALFQGLDLLRMQLGMDAGGNSGFGAASLGHHRGQPARGSLLLKKFSFAPGENLPVTFVAPPGLPADAWIGIIPASVPHGDEARNDQNDLAYQYLNGQTSATLSFAAPQQPGDYDLRMHDTDSNGVEIASVSFRVEAKIETMTEPQRQQRPSPAAGPQLSPDRDRYTPGETITLHFSGLKSPALKDRVSLYRVGTDDSNPAESRYLAQKADGEVHFTAPPLPGDYEFRLFLDSNGGQTVVATSQPFSVETQP